MTVVVVTPETAELAKARGAFYTPPAITRFLARWAVRTADDRVLEPSAGDGAFLSALSDRFNDLGMDDLNGRIIAVEREAAEAAKAKLIAPDADVRCVDFFDLDPGAVPGITAVVGNPPYIRYHGFHGTHREKARARSEAQGVQLTRLASSWAHFVVHATGFLGPNGRLALVLPAELLHTDYAGPVRSLLSARFASVTIIAFDRAVFPTAQVDAVLLLASNDEPPGFRVVRQSDVIDLETLQMGTLTRAIAPSARWSGSVDADAGLVYEAAIAEQLGTPLGAFGHVDIGFVSGANDFFVISRERAADLRLAPDVLMPVVRRPSDVPGYLVRGDEMHVLLTLSRASVLDDATERYLATGRSRGIHVRYKCRVRSPWYAVPMPKRTPDAFLPYMHHLGPRLIVNAQQARNSNLLHGVAMGPDAPPTEAIAVAMASSLTLLSAEIEGRAYGGGVLKLETKEAERVLIPRFIDPAPLIDHLPEVDRLIRRGEIEHAAISVDRILDIDHDRMWAAYLVLRERRLGRKRLQVRGA